MNNDVDILAQARSLWSSQTHGVLVTQMKEQLGYPSGSLVPYCLDYQGRPVILISRLAKHTQNIAENPKVSLFITEAIQADVQTVARINCWGEAVATEDLEVTNRYQRYFPQAQSYRQQLDFDYFYLEPKGFYFVAGFGRITSFTTNEIMPDIFFSNDQELSVIEHMNNDHSDAIVRYCSKAGVAISEGITPTMVGIDKLGFHLRLGEDLLRFDFDAPVKTFSEIRAKLTLMAKS